jgi:hypothetical protein
MPRPLYPQEKNPWYPLDRRLGGPQSRSGRGGEEILYLTKHYVMKTYGGIDPRILNLVNRWRWVVSFIPRKKQKQSSRGLF